MVLVFPIIAIRRIKSLHFYCQMGASQEMLSSAVTAQVNTCCQLQCTLLAWQFRFLQMTLTSASLAWDASTWLEVRLVSTSTAS
jgi:hypothetical protein